MISVFWINVRFCAQRIDYKLHALINHYIFQWYKSIWNVTRGKEE